MLSRLLSGVWPLSSPVGVLLRSPLPSVGWQLRLLPGELLSPLPSGGWPLRLLPDG